MNKEEITKLVTYIGENLRASPSAGLPFVDSRNFLTRFLSKQNHVVFGRRGAGKTILVNSIANSTENLYVYLNLEDYKDITFPNIVIKILVAMFINLDERIRSNYPWYKFNFLARRIQKNIKSICIGLSQYLYEPDMETQEISTTESSQEELLASVAVPTGSGGAKTTRGKSKQIKRHLPINKLNYLRLELTKYKDLFLSISKLFKGKPVFLILDDFYFVPKQIQPDLADYFHRLTKGTSLFLKIATIKYRSKLYRRSNDKYTGVELEHDVSGIDMDYTMDNFDELQNFMRQLLDSAIKQSKADIEIDQIFAGDSFAQLSLASGGVPRDFLSLFVLLANNTASTGEPIVKTQVTEAAIYNNRNKMESMKKDSGSEESILESYLFQIKRHVYQNKRTNAFLIAKDELESNPTARQAIRELVDLRLIHLVDQNTSKAPSDGHTYEAYILDIGLYDNSRPRNFNQVEPGQRDERARRDKLRASPVINLDRILEPIPDELPPETIETPDRHLELSFE